MRFGHPAIPHLTLFLSMPRLHPCAGSLEIGMVSPDFPPISPDFDFPDFHIAWNTTWCENAGAAVRASLGMRQARH
jgi:hypothetical protein